MFDHISLAVTDLLRARQFYDAVLAPLGILPGQQDGRTASYVFEGRDDFTLIHSAEAPLSPYGTHICFRADSRGAVRAFHERGVVSGGSDDGAPGMRPQYSSTYYAAFLIDPDGYRIEAVTQEPEQATPTD